MKNETVGNSDTATDADMEPITCGSPLGAHEDKTFDAPVRITFYHSRKRLADMDGLSVKAAIDGLVEAGILTGDTPKQVKEIRHHQIKRGTEETKIVIEEI